MGYYVWPTRWFAPPDAPTPELAARTISGGASSSGLRQFSRTDGGGLWRVQFSNIALKDHTLLAAWDAWHGVLDAGVTQVVVPKSMGRRAPAPRGVNVPEQFAPSPFPVSHIAFTPSGPIKAVLVGASDLRATQVTIRMIAGRNLVGGEPFSMEGDTWSWRRYKVVEVISTTPNEDGVDHVVNIRPPLREAYADQWKIDFNAAACLMQVDKMELPTCLRWGQVSISFSETFGT